VRAYGAPVYQTRCQDSKSERRRALDWYSVCRGVFHCRAGPSRANRKLSKPAVLGSAPRRQWYTGSVSALVTLTTDFGLADPYVAEMKGVLVREGPPDLRLLDLSHELPPFEIAEAALFLRAAVPRFPAGTVHLVVVDPGVGSVRQAIIARVGGQTLVGPDNRVFGYLYDGSEEVFVIAPEPAERTISSTFHGRDVFAPAAAKLAAGCAPEQLGKRAESYQHMVFPLVEFAGDTLAGRVIHIDRFGNLITNITRVALANFLGALDPGGALVSIGERSVRGMVDHYAEGKTGELVALLGSNGLLELAVREGSAARKFGIEIGKHVRVQRGT
jgi:S-adenosylmethionine hydrolase